MYGGGYDGAGGGFDAGGGGFDQFGGGGGGFAVVWLTPHCAAALLPNRRVLSTS